MYTNAAGTTGSGLGPGLPALPVGDQPLDNRSETITVFDVPSVMSEKVEVLPREEATFAAVARRHIENRD